MIKATVRSMIHRLKLRWYTPKYRLPDDYHRIYHYHIRKSAGTSLNSAFWALADLNLSQIGRRCQVIHRGFIFVRHVPELINRGQYFYANSHNPAYRLSLPPKTFTITILRDPLKRLLSYYRYLYYVQTDPQAAVHEPFYDTVKQEAEAMLGEGFADFLQKIPKKHLKHQLHMFSASYDVAEAVDRASQCSAVCFTESFSEDLAGLRQRLQLNLQERRDRAFSISLDLTEADLDQARQLLQDEYAMIDRLKTQLRPGT